MSRKVCPICGDEFDEEDINENGVCLDCAVSILYTEEIYPNISDF